jgi:Xaa-Pro aminopeptidase
MNSAYRPDWSGRLRRLQSQLAEHRVGALVVSTPLNIAYLSGFTGSTALLAVFPDDAVLVTDGRYDLIVRRAMAAGSIADVGLEKVQRRYDLTLAELLARRGIDQAGFEPAHVTVSTLGTWGRAAPRITWAPVERIVERLRVIKDAGEIEIFRRGGRLISDVARQLPSFLEVGRTEKEVAALIDRAIVAAGFERPSFATIVAAGPNSAQPHATPGSRPLSAGDLVVLDFGGVLDGYCLDLTRAAAVGSVSDAAKSLFDAVYAAHGAAMAAVRPGISTSEVDRAAREVLEAKGLGDAFSHSTGHGLGLEVHEAPRVAKADPETVEAVEAGMVFTVEPGAYLETVGGVRLEDDVLVTPTGREVLTTAPLDLLVV